MQARRCPDHTVKSNSHKITSVIFSLSLKLLFLSQESTRYIWISSRKILAPLFYFDLMMIPMLLFIARHLGHKGLKNSGQIHTKGEQNQIPKYLSSIPITSPNLILF